MRRSRRAPRIVAAASAAAFSLIHTHTDAAVVTSTWNSSTSVWSAASNWANVPLMGGFPNNGNGGVATYDAVVSGGQVTLDLNITIEKLTLGGNGIITGTNNLTTNDLITWSGGTLSGTGLSNANGGILMNANPRTLNGRIVNSPGVSQWIAGTINSGNGAIFNNSGTFTTNFNGNFVVNQGTPFTVFNNTGIFRKTAGTGQTVMAPVLNNTGSLISEVGTIALTGGGTGSGTFFASNNATIDFASNYTLHTGAVLTGGGSARVTGQTLTLAGNIPANNFDLTAGTLTGGGDFTPNQLNVSGGTMTGTGRTLIAPAANLNISGSVILTQRTLANSGTASWTAGVINSGGTAVLHNTGVFTTSFNGNMAFNQGGTQTAFNNAGVFRKTGGTGNTIIGAQFNNTGTVIAEVGTIRIDGGGSASSPFTASNGAFIDFNSTSYTLNNGANLIGNGTSRLIFGTLTLAGNISANNFDLVLGTLTGPGDFTPNRLNWINSTMTGAGRTLIAPSAEMNILGAVTFTQRTISNSGTATWSNGNISSGGGAVFNNSGTFNATTDFSIFNNQGNPSGVFNNSGLFRKNGGTGITRIDTPFNNSGTVIAATGTIQFLGGGTATSAFTASNGAVIEFGGNVNHVLGTGAHLLGNGTARLTTTTTLTIAANISANNFEHVSGTLTGPGDFTVNNLFWSSGITSGSGRTVIPVGANLLIQGSVTHTQRTISNSGTTTWTGTSINAGNGSIFNNTGTFTTSVNGSMNNNQGGIAGVFNNSGVFRKTAGTATTTINAVFINTGTVVAETGVIAFTGGGTSSAAFTASNNAVIEFSGFTYNLAPGASFIGNGTARLSSATTLLLTGDVTANNFELNNGIITGGTDFTPNLLNWNSGTMTGTGRTIIGPSATMNITGINANLTQRTLNNQGTATWTSAQINSGLGSVFNNSGTFTTNFNGAMQNNQGAPPALFNNSGLFSKIGGTGVTTLGTSFFNSGTIIASTGRIMFTAGGVSTGEFRADPGASFEAQAGIITLNAGAKLTGNGIFNITNGTLAVAANVPGVNLDQTAGSTLSGPGTLTLSNSYNVSGGSMSGSGVTNVSPGATFTISTVNTKSLIQRTINNMGTATWSGGNFNTGEGAVFNNSATLDVSFDGQFNYSAGGAKSTFNNTGSLTKSAGTGIARFTTFFNNNGTVHVNAGTLQLMGGGTGSGSFALAQGTELQFTNQNYDLTAPASITGRGTVYANLNTVNLGGTFDVAAVEVESATLNTTAGASANSKVHRTDTLVITGGNPRLNLANNAMLINYSGTSPLPTVRAHLRSGFAGGAWNGTGIISSSALIEPRRAIGYGEASTVLGISGTQTAMFLGKVVDADTLLMRYTIPGDTDIDGQVSFVDLVRVASNFGINDGTAIWETGDSDYDGNVTFVDLINVAANFGGILPSSISGASAEFNAVLASIAVPEPAGMASVCLTGVLCLRRTRRPRSLQRDFLAGRDFDCCN